MKADETEVAGKIRSILNAQRTLEKNKRLLAKWSNLDDQRKKIIAEVERLPVPPVAKSIGQRIKIKGFENRMSRVYTCGDTEYVGGLVDGERWRINEEECEIAYAVHAWKHARCVERGLTREMGNAEGWVYELKKRVARQEKRIAAFGLQEVTA